MSNLSIFVDESGDFGDFQPHSPYYVVTLILHDQDKDISDNISLLNQSIRQLGHKPNFVIHTEPLIRKNESYVNLSPNERRALFTKLFVFIKKTDITYKTFLFEKRNFENSLKLQDRISRDISLFIRENLEFFQSFDKIILYYDNGQHELTRILNNALAAELREYEMRKVMPKDYKLFQAADLICTLAVLEKKMENNSLSRSDLLVFHNGRDLRKQYLIPLLKKKFKS